MEGHQDEERVGAPGVCKAPDRTGLGQSEGEKVRDRSIAAAFNYLPSGYRKNSAGDTQSYYKRQQTNCSKGKTAGCLRKGVEYAFLRILKNFPNKP